MAVQFNLNSNRQVRPKQKCVMADAKHRPSRRANPGHASDFFKVLYNIYVTSKQPT